MEWLVKITIIYYCGGEGIILSLGFICFGGTVEDTFLASYRVKYLVFNEQSKSLTLPRYSQRAS